MLPALNRPTDAMKKKLTSKPMQMRFFEMRKSAFFANMVKD